MPQIPDHLTRRTDIESFEPGEPIYREGERGSLLFLLIDGEVVLERAGVTVGTVQVGQLFGSEAGDSDGARTHSARTTSGARALPFGPSLLDRLAASDPEFAESAGLLRMRAHIGTGARLAAIATIALLLAAPLAATKRRAFMTSTGYDGNLAALAVSGATALDKADTICRQHATGGGLPNASTYRAWLSTSTTDAYCHVQGLSGKKSTGCNLAPTPPGGGPWYLENGATTFTGTLDELTGSQRKIFRPVILDELGHDHPLDEAKYWTGTRPDGTADDLHCGGWATTAAGGVFGNGLATSETWTKESSGPCSDTLRLLCLEPGGSDVVPQTWGNSSLTFVTSASGSGDLHSWPEAGSEFGLAAGDRICQELARDAHLPSPDSFVAWLSDGDFDAAERITSGGPFRRLDGTFVATSKADLLDGTVASSIHQDEHGIYLPLAEDVWTATLGDGKGSGLNCGDWESASGGQFTYTGNSSYARCDAWTEFEGQSCANNNRLYCVSNTPVLFWDGFELTGDTSRWSNVAP